ncbi:uncharacterized protein PG998_000780 [Apiospora kogelbergensis]|uniref:uncharacterized protein n=1 Tax=Apiospora kogelbergensis TaxID=1337665 RepID=UPI00312E5B92
MQEYTHPSPKSGGNTVAFMALAVPPRLSFINHYYRYLADLKASCITSPSYYFLRDVQTLLSNHEAIVTDYAATSCGLEEARKRERRIEVQLLEVLRGLGQVSEQLDEAVTDLNKEAAENARLYLALVSKDKQIAELQSALRYSQGTSNGIPFQSDTTYNLLLHYQTSNCHRSSHSRRLNGPVNLPPESLPNTPPGTPPRTSQPQTPENANGIQVCDGGLKGTSWEVNRFSDPQVKDGRLFITAHWEPTAVCIQDLTRGYTSCKEMVVRELGEEVWRSQKPYLQFEDAPKESSLCHKREKRPRQGRRARRRPRR